MATEEPMDSSSDDVELPPLYDYLYRDTNRIASYAAQFFGGLLQGSEETDSTDEKIEEQIQATASSSTSYTKGDGQSNFRSRKQISHAHDVVTGDVISKLLDNKLVFNKPVNASHGDIILVSGTLLLIDSSLTKLTIKTAHSMVNNGVNLPGVGQETLQGMMLVNNIFEDLPFPSAFLLQCDEFDLHGIEVQIVGTLKDSGMEEPISTYYFKHGSRGLSDVYILGIKEEAASPVLLPNAQMIGAVQHITQGLSEMLFPTDAIRVTPIALFRKLSSS